jgi:uncharacterized lipoprotein YajG
MRNSSIAAILVSLVLLAGCSRQITTQQINAQQADQLNAIAANTTEDAGNDIAQNGAQTDDVGQAYRAGATSPPRKY